RRRRRCCLCSSRVRLPTLCHDQGDGFREEPGQTELRRVPRTAEVDAETASRKHWRVQSPDERTWTALRLASTKRLTPGFVRRHDRADILPDNSFRAVSSAPAGLPYSGVGRIQAV